MKKLVVLILSLALLMTACQNENGNVSDDENNNNDSNTLKIEDYIKFTENTKYSFEGEGNEFATYTVYVDYINGNRIQTRTNTGGTESVRVLEISNGQLTELMYRGETYFRENFTDHEYTSEKILLKEPLKQGNSWSNGDSKSTISSISKEVVTPQGNLEAIEVTTENDQGTTIEYYALNKGLIKTIHKGNDYEVTSTLTNTENDVPLIQSVSLYYPDINAEYLNTVDVQVSFDTNDEPKDVIEQMVRDLSIGGGISPNTKINELKYNEENNSVKLDLSKEFITEMNAGSGVEGLILQSVANTIGTYYGVEDVYLTIDGGLYESGHMTFKEGEPLKVDYTNVRE